MMLRRFGIPFFYKRIEFTGRALKVYLKLAVISLQLFL